MSLKCTIFEIFTFEKYCDLGLGVTQGITHTLHNGHHNEQLTVRQGHFIPKNVSPMEQSFSGPTVSWNCHSYLKWTLLSSSIKQITLIKACMNLNVQRAEVV